MSGPKNTSTAGAPRALFFRLETSLFAVEGAHARQVVTVPNVTPVPRTPGAFLGLFTSGGALLPLIDPRPLLGFAGEGAQGLVAHDLAVLVHASPHTLALSVDEVVGFSALERGAMLPLGASSPEAFHHYGLGRWTFEGEDVVVLNIPKIAEGLSQALEVA